MSLLFTLTLGKKTSRTLTGLGTPFFGDGPFPYAPSPPSLPLRLGPLWEPEGRKFRRPEIVSLLSLVHSRGESRSVIKKKSVLG